MPREHREILEAALARDVDRAKPLLEAHLRATTRLVLAIDGGTSSSPRTVTGSFNWTASADDENDENCVAILNSTVTSAYKADAIYVYTYKSSY